MFLSLANITTLAAYGWLPKLGATMLAADFSAVLGTLPQWITAGTLATIVVAWWRRGVSLQGLSNKDLADIRGHYAKELERVVGRQRDCESREQALRERVRKLEDEMAGLYRTMIAASADRVLELGDLVPEEYRLLAQRTLAAQRKPS